MGKHTIELNFISNIKPKYYNFNKKTNKIELLNTDIFLFFSSLKLFLNKKITKKFFKNFFFKKIFFFIRPFKKKTITYLRAPYRYKLARNQVTFSRYYVTCRIFIYTENIKEFKNTYSLIKYNSNFFLNMQQISTNITNLVYIKHSYNIKLKNFFK